jgi:hypothetical protein
LRELAARRGALKRRGCCGVTAGSVEHLATAQARRARAQWAAAGVELAPARTEAQLEEFERANHVALPADLRAFFKECGGCRGEDAHHLRFWPLDELAADADSGGLWVFADYLAWSHAFALDLSGGRPGVFFVGGAVPVLVADNFTQLFARYLDAPASLTSSQSATPAR